MCNLTNKLDKKWVAGYKVVAVHKESGKSYSVAMGFCYDDHKTIPVVKKQNRLSGVFIDNILNEVEGAFTKEMEGRTAAFTRECDALNLAGKVYRSNLDSDYTTEVRKVALSVDLMKGNYGVAPVVAGRKMTFQEGEAKWKKVLRTLGSGR